MARSCCHLRCNRDRSTSQINRPSHGNLSKACLSRGAVHISCCCAFKDAPEPGPSRFRPRTWSIAETKNCHLQLSCPTGILGRHQRRIRLRFPGVDDLGAAENVPSLIGQDFEKLEKKQQNQDCQDFRVELPRS